MAKYLYEITYTSTGFQEILAEGGSKRREVIETAIRSLRGWLEAIYFSFGEVDLFLVVELPDNIAASAFSMIVTSGGMARVKTTVLISPEEIDLATKKTIDFKPT